MIKHVDEPKDIKTSVDRLNVEGSQSGVESNQMTQKSQDASGQDGKKKTDPEDPKKKESMSIHSQLDSSMMETSEDDEARRKEAEKAAKKARKGFSPEELGEIIDVELSETNTLTFLHIPGTVVNADTEEHT